jgi:sensor histidine kinase regulating citrate/malate metabolism
MAEERIPPHMDLSNHKEIAKIISWLVMPKVDSVPDGGFICETRDVFQARLSNLFSELRDPLLIAVIGEIGNNSFDHNLGGFRDITGVYFEPLSNGEKIVILADRGRGITATLKNVIPTISSDIEAVKIAFTEVISGRRPEQRGNGLKFVASAVKQSNWQLYFHSGTGVVKIANREISFEKAQENILGCLAVIKYL